ncbi:MAG: hypothetical protein ABI220_00750 [Candidatus Saccharimonadales bacterium]
MKRTYLEEDLHLIQKYFPGAKTVSLHTPFDLTDKPADGHGAAADLYHDSQPGSHWYGDLAWNR